jgi:hypothetical protein
MSKMTIEITPEQHQQIKMLALQSGKTIKDFILEKSLGVNSNKRTLGNSDGKYWISDNFDDDISNDFEGDIFPEGKI